MIGIIGAMDVEIELLKSDLDLEKKSERAQMVFYQGKLKGKEVVLVKSGIGKVNAAVCTQILVDDFSVDKVIFTGVAGAVDKKLDVGDIVISTDTIQHDVNSTVMGYELGEIAEMNKAKFIADQTLISLAKDAGEKLIEEGATIKVVTGRVLSGDQFIADDEKVEWLKETFGGYCAEMEGAAVGQACFLNDLPFVIIRSMSDKADGSADVDYSTFMEKAANRSYRIVEEMLDHI
ncbi:5'-methylthioadenosine/adenosylhomocysteine nucleosidase [Sporohalobacter salinus]|uniref:5'-methylthioadenosine/adenosylhomocysteine nucleosidase n=1 Tax=Sporohalobacter salinus TaxID=1494606 RepID=UPI00195F817C|nr:5'-methylthioadenosine/adenosylhomocysteine nucleosidase [Sporohalobacter salinus]MBM7624943.1 adenosylhomocysteine nucleosidase [Sporohalobacter salinus]